MKILLIIPPSPFLGDQKRNPALGIMYIASFLEKNGYEVQIIDLRNVIENEWLIYVPMNEIYGITATTPEYSGVVKIVKLLKKRDSKCTIVLGGMHATTATKIDDMFDCIIKGEGELSIIKVINDYKENKLKKNYETPLMGSIDLPFPARHLLEEDSFINEHLCEPGERATAIMASRGCPFNCSFCASERIWKRRTRYRSPENVYNEIKHIIDTYNVRYFRFQDDTITVNKKWILLLCDLIKDLDIKWRANTRVDFAEKYVMEKMFEAGCYELDFGIEDVSQEVLDINNKKVKVEEIYTAMKNTKEVGINVRAFLMIGLPGQGHDVSDNIIEFIEKSNPGAVDLSTFIPLPGSDIYDNPDKYNIKLKDDFDLSDYVFTVGLYGDEAEKDFVFEHDKLTNKELKFHRRKILEYIQKRKMVLNK